MTAATCAFTTISDILLRPHLLRLGWNIMFACMRERTDGRTWRMRWFLVIIDLLLVLGVVQLYCVGYAMQCSREQGALVCVNVRGWAGCHDQLSTVASM